jgi:RHS repeat-associated protein
VGNITKICDRTPEGGIPNSALGTNALDRSFSYDPIYRLLSATGRECDLPPESPPWVDEPRCTDLTRTRAYTENYQYDSMGNIQQLQHQVSGTNRNRNFALVNGNNRLDTVTIGQTVYRYTYDVNGNLIQENGARHFEWDYGDRMRVFRTQTGNAEPSVYAHYLYDASGQRVKKLVRKQGGQVEVTVYIDGVFEYQRIVQDGVTRENNTLHVMDDQSRIALVRVGNPFPDDTTPAVKFHLGDHLGSSNVVVDEAGNWVNREEYTPYGETSFGSFARKRYRFTGKERDEESGLNYHGARYYVSWMVRWISCDPAGMIDGINLYRYARSNPVNLIDLKGLDSSTDNISDAGTKMDSIPGGVVNDPKDQYEYKADPNRIEGQDQFAEDFHSGVHNTVLDKIGPKAGIQQAKKDVASLPFIGPRLADFLISPLEKKVNSYYDKLKLEAPQTPLGNVGYATGVLTVELAESLVFSAAIEAKSASLGQSLQSSGVMQSTGIARFDELAVGTERYTKWVETLKNRRWTVRPAALGDNVAAEITAPIRLLEINEANFRYIDLLHESRHVAQVELSTGFTSWGRSKIRNACELDAYRYELRLGQKFGFSESYMHAISQKISAHKSLSRKYQLIDKEGLLWTGRKK